MADTIGIGPPNSGVEGMNTTLTRQQLPPNAFWMLRNIRLRGESWEKVKGTARLLAGARRAMSLQSNGADATYGTISVSDQDAVTINEYALETRWAVFVAYRVDSLATPIMVASHSDEAVTVPWRITHNTNGTVTALITTATTSATITTPANYGKIGASYTALLVRNGTTVTLYMNDAAGVAATTLSATEVNIAAPAEDLYFGGWSGIATGSNVTYYELRIFRDDDPDRTWRKTQYPWSGRFGNANLICHLTFEDGSGTAVTDWSRTYNTNISLSGAWTWSAATPRKVVSPVTGIHVLTKATGRKWLIVDQDRNHYRIPLN